MPVSGRGHNHSLQSAGLVDAQVAIDAVRCDVLPRFELEALADQGDFDLVGFEGDQVPDRRHPVEGRAIRPRCVGDAVDVVVGGDALVGAECLQVDQG